MPDIFPDNRYLSRLPHLPQLENLCVPFFIRVDNLDYCISAGNITTGDLMMGVQTATQACKKQFPDVISRCSIVLEDMLYQAILPTGLDDGGLMARVHTQDQKSNFVTYYATPSESPNAWHGLDLTIKDSGYYDHGKYEAYIKQVKDLKSGAYNRQSQGVQLV